MECSQKEIRLFNADSLEYSGSIMVTGSEWEFKNVNDAHLIKMTTGMPLKAVMVCLISYNLVYEIH